VLPAIVIDDTLHSVSHPVQVASALGIDIQPHGDAARVGWDLNDVLGAWIDCARMTPWEAWLAITPSRERHALELAVNTFVPIELIVDAWYTGDFPWGPVDWPPGKGIFAYEADLIAGCQSANALLGFITPIQAAWSSFLYDEQASISEDPDREITMGRGTPISFGRLLEAQRGHAAHHYRQVITYFRSTGLAVPDLRLEDMSGLVLASTVY